MSGTSTMSAKAEDLIRRLVVVEGLSYVDAIGRLQDLAEGKAAPYKEAAGALQAWLDAHADAERKP